MELAKLWPEIGVDNWLIQFSPEELRLVCMQGVLGKIWYNFLLIALRWLRQPDALSLLALKWYVYHLCYREAHPFVLLRSNFLALSEYGTKLF
jgi:hypothetical protein